MGQYVHEEIIETDQSKPQQMHCICLLDKVKSNGVMDCFLINQMYWYTMLSSVLNEKKYGILSPDERDPYMGFVRKFMSSFFVYQSSSDAGQ